MRKLANNSSRQLPTWKRMISFSSQWEDKDEFLDVIYWGRQIASIVIGLIWGMLVSLAQNLIFVLLIEGLTGSFGLLSYTAVSSAIVYFYSINVNDESEDAIAAVKEGFMTSLSAFLVTWILVYTYLYF
ncbi:Rab5-interacting protein-like protein 1 [Sarcoptes scabiei]|uniref:Rab5-interacting protein-like protein 1 n=1 Tax=Sarcoptes scabiei TaxID=52283 RepID=A0A131ZSL1_SARSC|nr:Rab5-interacting protein-like protein 1 [Sarcoptes scabiei]